MGLPEVERILNAMHSKGKKEMVVYLALWLILYVAPAASLFVRMIDNPGTAFDWREVLGVWKVMTLFFALFLVHDIFVSPLLLRKRNHAAYFLLALGLVVVAVALQLVAHPDAAPAAGLAHDSIGGRGAFGSGRVPLPFLPGLGPDDAGIAFGAVLLMAMNVGIKLYFKGEDDAREMEVLERQALKSQMECLRYQVNPHFLMNTLNNIHALVEIDPKKSKEMILELSRMMRYIIYESGNGLTTVQREMDFVAHYVNLMRMRFTENVAIKLDIQGNVPERFIPPMVLIIFIENSFKHGVSYRCGSFISIAISFSDSDLMFRCLNSKHPNARGGHCGVGLSNVSKRLDMIYGDRYMLDIRENDDIYEARLMLPYCEKEQAVTQIQTENDKMHSC